MANTRFKVGDKVKIKKDTMYYGSKLDRSNPMDTVGTITEVRSDMEFCYMVEWPKGKNGYREGDLEPAKEYTVDEEFIRAAYDAACSTWKQKLEERYPEVLNVPTFLDILQNPKDAYHSQVYAYNTTTGKYESIKGVEILSAAADGKLVPKSARYRGLYICTSVTQRADILVQNTEEGYGAAITFQIKK